MAWIVSKLNNYQIGTFWPKVYVVSHYSYITVISDNPVKGDVSDAQLNEGGHTGLCSLGRW